MVVGLWRLRSQGRRGYAWGTAACLVPLVALCALAWESQGSYALSAVACALVIAFALAGRLSVTSVCLCILGCAALMAGIDEAILAMYGSSLPEYVAAVLEQAMEVSVGASSLSSGTLSVEVSAALSQTKDLLTSVWPLGYVGQAALMVLFGLAALGIARRKPYRSLYEAYLRFRVPLWGVVALVVAAVCYGVVQAGSVDSAVLQSAALCVLFFLRVLFFLQGLAVAMFLMEKHSFGAVGRIASVMLLLLVEFAFYAVSVFGAVDVLADFRRLVGRGRDVETRGTR